MQSSGENKVVNIIGSPIRTFEWEGLTIHKVPTAGDEKHRWIAQDGNCCTILTSVEDEEPEDVAVGAIIKANLERMHAADKNADKTGMVWALGAFSTGAFVLLLDERVELVLAAVAVGTACWLLEGTVRAFWAGYRSRRDR